MRFMARSVSSAEMLLRVAERNRASAARQNFPVAIRYREYSADHNLLSLATDQVAEVRAAADIPAAEGTPGEDTPVAEAATREVAEATRVAVVDSPAAEVVEEATLVAAAEVAAEVATVAVGAAATTNPP